MSSKVFVDRARIYVKAGKGGDGVNSFYRDRLNRRGFPDGGPGGRGGDVILRVSPHLKTLLDFQYRQHISAEKGSNGSGKNKKGRNGNDTVIQVPIGTLVFDNETDQILADLVASGQEICAVRGGKGGKGNDHRTPAASGEPGQERTLRLELKLLADVGLIGYPNAGKSTLLAALSNARPKIASYPFTTLTPQLGLVEWKEDSFSVADIPGLIEGAHSGKGLGDEFLRHIERTRILLLLLDIAATEGRDPFEDYGVLLTELERYNPAILEKERLIVANKIDLPEAQENLTKFRRRVKKPVYAISAKEKMGLEKLLDAMTSLL